MIKYLSKFLILFFLTSIFLGFKHQTKILNNSVEILPFSPIPTSKDSYAIVLKMINPQRTGLYQFHSFGKSSGNVPISSYLGSWTIKIDQL